MVARGEYRPRDYYERDPRIRRVLDAIADDRLSPQDPGLFRWVRDALLEHDEYFVLADFAAYIDTQQMIARQYAQRGGWTRKAILNVARIGRFSSDRAVREYARDIWHLS
jgi:starch phosphorylase